MTNFLSSSGLKLQFCVNICRVTELCYNQSNLSKKYPIFSFSSADYHVS